MKKITITSFILLLTICVSAQVRRDYYIQSIPYHDSMGNITIYRQTYDYQPTKEDSIEFEHNLGWRLSIQSAVDYSINELKKKGYITDDKKKTIKKKTIKKLNN
jgi:hypothetical protein